MLISCMAQKRVTMILSAGLADGFVCRAGAPGVIKSQPRGSIHRILVAWSRNIPKTNETWFGQTSVTDSLGQPGHGVLVEHIPASLLNGRQRLMILATPVGVIHLLSAKFLATIAASIRLFLRMGPYVTLQMFCLGETASTKVALSLGNPTASLFLLKCHGVGSCVSVECSTKEDYG